MNYAVGYFVLGIGTFLLFTLSVMAQLGFIGPGEIYLDGQQVALGPAVAEALNSGGLQLLADHDFPRATERSVEAWGLQVNGEWTYMALDWSQGHATVLDQPPARGLDVKIETGTHIATQIYNAAMGGVMDRGWANIAWAFTGITPSGYKGMLTIWIIDQL